MRSLLTRKKLALLSVLALTLTSAACGGGTSAEDLGPLPDQFSALDDLYEEATADGQTKVVLYGTTVEEKKPLIEVFEARYPDIEVQTVRLLGANLTSKLQQEVSSGQVNADLVLAGSSSHYRQADMGWYTEPELIGIEDLPEKGRVAKDHVYAPSGTVFGIAYNKREVSEDEAPKGWEDLTDPKWKERIGVIDPHSFNGTTVTMAYLINAGVIDEDWVGQLSDQDPRVVGEGSQLGESLVTGKADVVVGYPLGYAVKDNDKGADIGYVFPTEGGSILSPEYLALMKDAPHNKAATLFMNWLFTPEAQEKFADIGEYPMMPDADTPDGVPSRDEVDNLVDLPSGKELGAEMESTVGLTESYF